MQVKICGITRMEDGVYAYESGADLIGVVLSSASPRKGSMELVRLLAKEEIPVVAVHTSIDDALRMEGDEKYVQLHFNTSEEEIEKAEQNGRKVITVVNIDGPDYLEYFNRIRPESDLVLLESRNGISHEMGKIAGILDDDTGIAGKIGPENIRSLVSYNPGFVDLSSSLEISPGKKDTNLVDSFFRRLKNAEITN